MKKEIIYDVMNGFIDLESVSEPLDILVQNEFCNGRECEKILNIHITFILAGTMES